MPNSLMKPLWRAGCVTFALGLGVSPAICAAQDSTDPPAAASASFSMSWEKRPKGSDIADVYPTWALRDGIAGAAVISCGILADGRLEQCKVLDEAPKGAGFGDAAVKLGRKFKIKVTPETPPVAGGNVRIPIHFVPPR